MPNNNLTVEMLFTIIDIIKKSRMSKQSLTNYKFTRISRDQVAFRAITELLKLFPATG